MRFYFSAEDYPDIFMAHKELSEMADKIVKDRELIEAKFVVDYK